MDCAAPWGKRQFVPSDKSGAQVRRILGRPGAMWGAESGTDRLVVAIRNRSACRCNGALWRSPELFRQSQARFVETGRRELP
jgi:hypothetical protein